MNSLVKDFSTIQITQDDFKVNAEYEADLYTNYPEIHTALMTLSVAFPRAVESVKKEILTTYEIDYIQLRDAKKWTRETFSKFQQLYIFIAILEAKITYAGYEAEFLLNLKEILQKIELKKYSVRKPDEEVLLTKDLKEFEKYLFEYSQEILIFTDNKT